MNASVGAGLAVLALMVGWFGFGWQGLVVAVTVIGFWMLLQFNHAIKVMRLASKSPVGYVPSAVMLNAKLETGLPMLDLMKLTRSLGRKTGDSPETFVWKDPGGSTVTVRVENGRCTHWELHRPSVASEATDPP